MFSRMSQKVGTKQIGRFGLGFKSVLGVTDKPEFYSRSVSVWFDALNAERRLRSIAPGYQNYPVLRLPQPIDPELTFKEDPILRRLAHWATNIVRLPLKPGVYDSLSEQITLFPPEFLLFVAHVRQLAFDTEDSDLVLSIHKEGEQYYLSEGNDTTKWKLFELTYRLPDKAIADDRRSMDAADHVLITWAVPLDRHRLRSPGYFWAYFPTMTASLLSGILNAPWKTNEDRQNLLKGFHNEEMISTAAFLIAESLPTLSTEEDPGCRLDTLPRREEQGDGKLTTLLRRKIYRSLVDTKVIPDQNGKLFRITDLKYPPQGLSGEVLKRWASYQGRPSGWVHHSAMTRQRRSTIDRIFDCTDNPSLEGRLLPTDVAEWLEALVAGTKTEKDSVQASMIAIQVAALIPEDRRRREEGFFGSGKGLGKIVLSDQCQWKSLDPDDIFLKGNVSVSSGNHLVHSELEADPQTLDSLRQLGLNYITKENSFQRTVEDLFARKKWGELWRLSRDDNQEWWLKIIRNKQTESNPLHVRNIAGNWHPITKVLLPGPIVPTDGSRDQAVAVDIVYHGSDHEILEELGVIDSPRDGYDDLDQVDYREYESKCYDQYLQELPAKHPKPRDWRMEFVECKSTGPLSVMKNLSKEGKVRYTEALLDLDSIYEKWIMRHRTRFDFYRDGIFDSLAVETLRKYGYIRLSYDIVKLFDDFDGNPVNPEVRRWLLERPKSHKIREAFDIEIEPVIDPVDESVPILLIDEWPGLRRHIFPEHRQLSIIRCGQVGSDSSGYELECILKDNSIYIRIGSEEEQEFRAVLRELELSLTDWEVDQILLRITSEDVAMKRGKVCNKTTDAERLLAAVGENELRRGLPGSLLRYWQKEGIEISGVEVAEAAIATFDVGALREYRDYLEHLDPPRQWAGRRPAVDFVRSLGFGVEWAGQGKTRRSQYEEVAGPYSLPDLHDYQRVIADNVRRLLSLGELDSKRGLISLPTGSGKTRVAVQAIVEAIREKEYRGSVLWVADRDELCEQAVESWRQIWPNIGVESVPLKISRLWGNQKNPTPVNGPHVIVASVQTLYNRIVKYHRAREFLDDCRLVVFDEAHRSIARTYTGVLEALGLTRSQKRDSSFLIGLTATPYRGHNEDETRRLVNRYGRNRLDTGAFQSDDPEYVTRELQSTGVLAQADHETIRGGEFSLTIAELAEMIEKRMPWLPKRIEKEIGADTNRTRRILDAYNQYIRGRGWPTLIFATSVDHSKALAALLNQSGVVARPVDGTTHPSTRRKIVEDFRSGKIEALVNYAVFREGFDAPRTRAIVVARPVYSPNLYFQMIGRGLRGPLNGGNERCLILNVWDNIENYEEKLAFTELEWLWANG